MASRSSNSNFFRRLWIWLYRSSSSSAVLVRLTLVCAICVYLVQLGRRRGHARNLQQRPRARLAAVVETVETSQATTVPWTIPGREQNAVSLKHCLNTDWNRIRKTLGKRNYGSAQDLVISLTTAEKKGHLNGCGPTLIDIHCHSVHNSSFYDYRGLESAVSSCAADQYLKGGEPALTLGFQPSDLPPTFMASRKSHESVRIAFLYVVYSSALLQQIKRTVALMVRPVDHVFFHVDKGPSSTYLRSELALFAESTSNAHLIPTSWDTTWAGSGLLKMYLGAIRYMMQFSWSHFINLSEVDFPVLTTHMVAAQLAKRRGISFLNANIGESVKMRQAKISRQGQGFTSIQCQRYMYRLAPRKIPQRLQILTGSDWFIISREFADWVSMSNSRYVKSLSHFYAHTILSAESFFHTAAFNSPWCRTIVWNNHRFENWHPGEGCQCSKQFVDWCGCSPLTLRYRDTNAVIANGRGKWHIRKVDARIDMKAINAIENHLLRESSREADFRRHVYWSNVFNIEQSSDFMRYAHLIEHILRSKAVTHLRRCGYSVSTLLRHPTSGLLSVHEVFDDGIMPVIPDRSRISASLTGSLGLVARVLVQVSKIGTVGNPAKEVILEGFAQETHFRESFVKQQIQRIQQHSRDFRLEAIDLGGRWDLKEKLFRLNGPVFLSSDHLRARFRWRPLTSNGMDTEVSFIGCYGNGGKHTRWLRKHTPGLTLDECAMLAATARHTYFAMEWAEGYDTGRAQCASLQKPPSDSFRVTNKECTGVDGRLLGRYFRAAIYRVKANSTLWRAKPTKYSVQLSHSSGHVLHLGNHSISAQSFETYIDFNFNAMQLGKTVLSGEWILQATSLTDLGRPSVTMPFIVEKEERKRQSAVDILHKFVDLEGVCVHSPHTLCTAIPLCSNTKWSSLRRSLNLTLT